MILVEPDKRFELTILGYECAPSDSYHDSNWLNVAISAVDHDLSWQANDSCLLSYELVALREWIKTIIVDMKVDSEIGFTENELGFRFLARDSILAIVLDFHLHPKGARYKYGDDGDDEYVLEFNMNQRKLNAVLAQIEAWICRFPVRS